ncbi:MAG: hypothetical protein HYY44_08355 [Deltaproteobacteria bacterium]|nr:hypothetical protein [Deltaproteobacteria bacterium]
MTDDEKVNPDYQNNCINLWFPGVSIYPEKNCLSVEDLKGMIRENMPSDVPISFAMAQCYSGAFHGLGYSRDQDGFPRRDGNACGFTAVTKDTTSAGCTDFVEEDLYDGYERRIAEAITGRSVLSGETIGDPILSLLEAHNSASLLDDTKDQPLRTSESYVLDYAEAHEMSFEKNEDRLAFRATLGEIWQELAGEKSPLALKLVPTLGADLERRLVFVEKLRSQLVAWRRFHKFALGKADLSYLSQMREGVGLMVEKLDDKRGDLWSDFKKRRAPVRAKFILDLKRQDDPEKKKLLELQTLGELGQEVIYSRLFKEDASLKKLERFLSFSNNYNENLLGWAEKRDDIKKSDIEKLKRLRVQIETIDRELMDLAILKGELQRLENQMVVASMVGWMVKNLKGGALVELTDLVKCESEASLVP